MKEKLMDSLVIAKRHHRSQRFKQDVPYWELECVPNKLEKKLSLKFQIHDILFSKSKIRIEVRSRSDHKLIDNSVVQLQPEDIKKEANGILNVSISQEIPSFEHETAGTLRIVHDKLGEPAFQNFDLTAEVMQDDFELDTDQTLSGEFPALPTDYQRNDLLKAGIEYNHSTREIKITTDDYSYLYHSQRTF